MKKYFALAVLVAVLGASAAFAEVQDFGIFKADILAGWTAEQDGNTVGILKDDNTSQESLDEISTMIDSLQFRNI